MWDISAFLGTIYKIMLKCQKFRKGKTRMPYKMNRLRQLREEKELKQTTVAADLGISRTTLSNYEAGMMPSIENGIALANYYHVSLDYIVGLSAERSTNAGALTSSFVTLAGMAGDVAPTASDVAALVNAAIMYEATGKPCGEQPLAAWRDFMRHLTKCLQAAVTGDSAALVDNANAATVAALEVTKMPAAFYKKKGGTDQ